MEWSTVEDFVALKSMLLEDELHYDELMPDDTKSFWNEVDAETHGDATKSHYPLKFATSLPGGALLVDIKSYNAFPQFTFASDSRSKQIAWSAKLAEISNSAGNEDMPMFYVYTTLQAEADMDDTESQGSEGSRHSHRQDALSGKVEFAASEEKLKTALLWSHHLLANSKRKDIQHWSTELQVWAIAKVGYPGVIVLEGFEDDVNEFIRRIKALQWYALQLRYEQTNEKPIDGSEQDCLQACHLAQVIETTPDKRSKISALEVHSMSDLSSLMTKAGLRDAFASAMKLPS